MEIIELILWIILEVLGDVLIELLLEPGLARIKEARRRENRKPAVATLGYAFLGGALGGVSVLVFPHRLLRAGPIPGLSLILGPIGGALVMELWGRYRRAHGNSTTNLATWYGGGGFAVGMSLVRYLLVH